MKYLKFSLLFLVALFTLSACTTFKASGLSMSTVTPSYTVLGDFSESIWVSKFIGTAGGATLFNLSDDATDPAVKTAIQSAIAAKGGTAAINVSITYKASFVNMLLNSISLRLYAPGTVEITGTIVK